MKSVYLLLCILLLFPPTIPGQYDEEAAIRNLFVMQFAELWEGADPEGLASLWHEEGDWMNLVGSRRIRRGRAQIAQVWAIGLQGRDSAGARALTIEIDSIKMLDPKLAQVDLVMIFGHERNGIIREGMFAIVRKGDSGWKIVSTRVARISSSPAALNDGAGINQKY